MKLLFKSGQSWKAVDADAYSDESHLQSVVHSIPGVLLGTDFAGPKFLVSVREFSLPGAGTADLLAVARDGSILLAECKLAKNDEIRRKVIGQILEYAAALWRMPYDELDLRVRKLKEGRPLAELMREESENHEPGEWDQEEFVTRVQANLDAGTFLLVIVVDELSESLSKILNYVNERGRESRFSLFALELVRFTSGTAEVVVPHLHGPTADELAGKREVTSDERGRIYQRFFQTLIDGFKAERPNVTSAARPSYAGWFGFPAGLKGCSFNWSFAQGKRLRIELYIEGPDRASAEAAYRAIEKRRAQIERSFGSPLQWEPLFETKNKRSCRIAVYHDGNPYDDPHIFDSLAKWGIETMVLFYDALRPALKEVADTPPETN